MSMNFNPKKPAQPEPKTNHTKTIIGIIILAVIMLAVTIMALELAHGMNDVVSPFSSVDRPVSVLEAQFSK